ncbi:XdhC family protein [Anoxynatronum buryatiense]|uniref:Xanthine dehydrogenase accessory factor n=1 Tax=Anoxynatronum buryatiense TaxID=489973 RepID=A0AA45WVA7_9CLOT|nr:XdhC/CoxI family protein [Anoxynatronum buryatiense]SMP51966.1 xanthine dehydrogenase accessory factor [Anoxynatronum buryatiense]
MEINVLKRVTEEMTGNRSVALITVTEATGSTPGKTGAMMAVLADGTSYGTVGGGKLEGEVTKTARECLKTGEDRLLNYHLKDDAAGIGMQCGGDAQVFIKVFRPQNQLILVGGGHIAQALYHLGMMLGFRVTVVEDRKEFASRERFPEAEQLLLGDMGELMASMPLNNGSYVVIVSRGHQMDELALRAVLGKPAAYVGMIGSRTKVAHTVKSLRETGVSEEQIRQVYMPIGLDLGGQRPEEIAVSIMAQIMSVKYGTTPRHLKMLETESESAPNL